MKAFREFVEDMNGMILMLAGIWLMTILAALAVVLIVVSLLSDQAAEAKSLMSLSFIIHFLQRDASLPWL